MALATIPGYPRIGRSRELKAALEHHWRGALPASELAAVGGMIRAASRASQRTAGMDILPVNDFTLYDRVLDTTAMVGAVPERFGWDGETVDLDTYFAMARGRPGDDGAHAMEMTKWFDTNYHHIVPELDRSSTFRPASTAPLDALAEARTAGVTGKVVLLGPVTWLRLAKVRDDAFDPLELLDALLPVYGFVIRDLAAAGAEWIQMDEPILVTGVDDATVSALKRAYRAIGRTKGDARIIVNTYFDHVADVYDDLVGLPIDGIGLDLVRGAATLERIGTKGFPADKVLVAGVVDGRNVWVDDLRASLELLQRLGAYVSADRIHVSTSCSLQHVPLDVTLESRLDPEVRGWLAFAVQKLDEVRTLATGLTAGEDAIAAVLAERDLLLDRASMSERRHSVHVAQRLGSASPDAADRGLPAAARGELQRRRLDLPILPTTTIGSFPQTDALRAARRRLSAGEITDDEYEAFIADRIRDVVAQQESLDIDVLVHGEPERNDMVQYFGERLDGFAFTEHGWVQSYGSRYVRPPLLFGDVARPHPMTVRWATFAQSLTERPVKGMLTGPATILNWSFVRDDQPRAVTCRQIAWAMRDEVADLDAAGICMIQIDEAALREGLPLRREDWDEYLDWAVEAFRITAAGARPETQIHTHMCYSQVDDIFGAIGRLDADVISIENARSGLELLETFRTQGYDRGIGPGVYDIHSPRVPPTDEIADNLRATLTVLDASRVWVNPDCGLKTRTPEEASAALRNMVSAAKRVRKEVSAAA